MKAIEIVDPALEEELLVFLRSRDKAKEHEREAADIREDLRPRLLELSSELGTEKFRVGTAEVLFYPRTTTKVDKDMLLMLGVDPEVIQKATIASTTTSMNVTMVVEGAIY
tara:strand:- start:360 stop:692 length:333 start_codon:yes stop_codon:yes gene_type:complete